MTGGNRYFKVELCWPLFRRTSTVMTFLPGKQERERVGGEKERERERGVNVQH